MYISVDDSFGRAFSSSWSRKGWRTSISSSFNVSLFSLLFLYSIPFSPSSAPTKKIKFNMSSKIQIIPNNRQGQLNTGYIGTMAGVLKLAEIVRLSFLPHSLLISPFSSLPSSHSFSPSVPIVNRQQQHGQSILPSRPWWSSLFSFLDTSASPISLSIMNQREKDSSLSSVYSLLIPLNESLSLTGTSLLRGEYSLLLHFNLVNGSSLCIMGSRWKGISHHGSC